MIIDSLENVIIDSLENIGLDDYLMVKFDKTFASVARIAREMNSRKKMIATELEKRFERAARTGNDIPYEPHIEDDFIFPEIEDFNDSPLSKMKEIGKADITLRVFEQNYMFQDLKNWMNDRGIMVLIDKSDTGLRVIFSHAVEMLEDKPALFTDVVKHEEKAGWPPRPGPK